MDATRSTISDHLSMLRRRWAVLAVVGLTVFGLFAPYVLGLPKLYRASATVLVERLGMQGDTQAVPGEIDARLQAIKQEALSRARLTDLIDRFDLYPDLRRPTNDAALARLQNDIKVENISTEQINGQESTIAFKLSYVGKDPAGTAAVTNTLASFYVAQNDRIRTQRASRNTEILKDQLASARKRLDQQQVLLHGYTVRNIGALPQQLDANLAALERFNSQLRVNSDEQMKLMERRETLQNQIAELDTKPPADPNGPAAQLMALKKQLADLQARVTDKHPDVRELKEQVATLERQTAASRPSAAAPPSAGDSLKASLAETQQQFGRIDTENRAIRQSISDYERRVESAPSRGPEFQSLTRDYEVTRDQYDALQKRYDEALLTERAEASTSQEEYRILDEAQAPTGAAGPNSWRLLAFGLILGLGVGIVAAVLAEWLDTSFHSVDDLRAFTRVPVLASIPDIRTGGDSWFRAVRAGALVASTGVAITCLGVVAFSAAHVSESVARLLLKLG